MRLALLLFALAAAACSPLETAEAVCRPGGVYCPPPETCGLWLEACAEPTLCPDGESRVDLGNTVPLVCNGDRPTCPDGSETFCVFVPDTGPLVPSECNAPASLCDL